MKRMFGIFFLAALPLSLVAASVSCDEAAQAVRTWIGLRPQLGCRMGGTVADARTCSPTNDVTFHVVKLAGGGFVVTSSDTEIEPVLAFSESDDLEESERNPLWTMLRRDLTMRVARRRQAQLAATGASSVAVAAGPAAKWARLLPAKQTNGLVRLQHAAIGKESLSDVRVAPLLGTKWNQKQDAYYSNMGSPCYNYYTPSNYPCGCVATAIAQIMRYHRFPTASVIPGTYACRVETGKNWISATSYYPIYENRNLTMQGGVYAWDEMPFVPADGTSLKQRQAIGRLTSDVGIACLMSYGEGASSAGGYMAARCLPGRFGFANATAACGDSFAATFVRKVLVSNLDAKLPVLAGLDGPAGGHAVVVDGYGYSLSTFYAHFNLGWSGRDDAWYAPPDVTDDFNAFDSLVYNVYPKGVANGVVCSGRVLSPSGDPVSNATVNVVGTSSASTVTDGKGIYAFILKPGSYTVSSSETSKNVTLTANVATSVSEDGYYYSTPKPQVNNVCDLDLTVSAEPPPEEPPVVSEVRVMARSADATGGKVSGGASVKPDRNGLYKAVTLKATPNKGYWFAGWYDRNGEWTSGALSFKVTPKGDESQEVYEARFVKAKPSLCATYNGSVVVSLKGMTLVRGADTSEDVWCDCPLTVTLSTAGKLSGSVSVGGKKVSFSADGCLEASDGDGVTEENPWATFRFSVDEKAWFGVSNVETLVLRLARFSSGGKYGDYGTAWLVECSSDGNYQPLGTETLGDANRATDKADVALLASFAGTYVLAFETDDGIMPLSVVVDKVGKVKASGKYADGTALTMSGTLTYRDTSAAWGGDGNSEDALVDLFATPKTLGAGTLHVSFLVWHGGDPDVRAIEVGGRATRYTASSVRASDAVCVVAEPYEPGCWIPVDADPDFGVVRLTSGEDVIDLTYASKNGTITGLGKALQSGVTAKFDVKTGLLVVSKGKEYVIQGVLGSVETGCQAAGRINADGSVAPVMVEYLTLPMPTEYFPWTEKDFVLTLGQNFGGLMQPSVSFGGSDLDLTVTGLPAGLKFDKKTGLISGAPTKVGSYTVKVSYVYGVRTITRTTTLVVSPKPAGFPVGSYAGSATVYVDGDAKSSVSFPFAATIDKNGALSGSVTLFGKKATFKTGGYDSCTAGSAAYTARLDLKLINKGWGELILPIWASGFEMSGGTDTPFGDGAVLSHVAAWRNQSKDEGYVGLVAPYVGSYVAALHTSWVIEGDARNGATVFSLVIDKKGAAKVAGTFADGTALSASAQLVVLEDGDCAIVTIPIALKSLAQGALRLSVTLERKTDEYTGEPSADLFCDVDVAKFALADGTYVPFELWQAFADAYSPLIWVCPSVTPSDTCISVSCDTDAFDEITLFDWKTKWDPLCGQQIVGVGKRLAGAAMTFKIDDKTGLFSGACGTYKIFGAMQRYSGSGIGTVVGKDGSVGFVSVCDAPR